MSHANRHILFGADGHPTLELLRQYQEGTLSPALSHQLERHLLDCELCADIVEGMAISSEARTNAAVADIKQRLAGKKEKIGVADWRAVAAVFVLLCSAVMVVYYQYTNLKATPETIVVDQTETIVEPSISYAPPAPTIEPEPEVTSDTEPIPAPAIARVQKPKANPETIASWPAVDEEAFDYEVADEEVLSETIALEEVTFDLQQDSVATIATAQPKTRVAAAAARMNFQQALEGKVAGVALQQKSNGANEVQGKVTDEMGNPLPGVTVQVKGTMLGVSTDKNGNFTIPLPEEKNVLTFRYIGFESKEQQIDSATNALAINLQPDNRQLSEVVVTGYSKPAATSIIEKPKPTIGQRAYKLYLKNEQRPLTTKVKGRVIVGFTVTEKGQLENLHVHKSLSPEADTEAIRLIQQGPAWEPAMQNRNPVARQVKVVVRFR